MRLFEKIHNSVRWDFKMHFFFLLSIAALKVKWSRLSKKSIEIVEETRRIRIKAFWRGLVFDEELGNWREKSINFFGNQSSSGFKVCKVVTASFFGGGVFISFFFNGHSKWQTFSAHKKKNPQLIMNNWTSTVLLHLVLGVVQVNLPRKPGATYTVWL